MDYACRYNTWCREIMTTFLVAIVRSKCFWNKQKLPFLRKSPHCRNDWTLVSSSEIAKNSTGPIFRRVVLDWLGWRVSNLRLGRWKYWLLHKLCVFENSTNLLLAQNLVHIFCILVTNFYSQFASVAECYNIILVLRNTILDDRRTFVLVFALYCTMPALRQDDDDL